MEFPKRKPTRLKDYDYSSEGAYFITICTKDKKRILSKIIVGESLCALPSIKLTPIGSIVEQSIEYMNNNYDNIFVDKFVIMPNHIHIIFVANNGGRGNPSPTICDVIGWLKYNATKQINKSKHTPGNKIFQRSFHDHIIRNEKDYLRIWEYIDSNPAKWEEDCFYTD